MLLILFLIIAFLLGSIPFSYIFGRKIKGIDLRQHGSGNLGSTNVFRLLGPMWGVLCLVLDMGKGAAAVGVMSLAVRWWAPEFGSTFLDQSDFWRVLAGVLAALGHTFSPFVGFKGGKGVATTAGGFAVLAPYAVLVSVVAFLAVFATTRIVSIGSITAASVMPLAVLFFELNSNDPSKTIILFATLICLWVLFKHRSNIQRLRQGTENRLDGPPDDHLPPPEEGV
ncbi:MAG: glycerol-3-phosphate 1-O-acyltransferase PlsY [Gemmatimonadales bacterium]|nr:glycerol-3-phosphate 1-O-acyltransferase PlsY [Gemmatimonadales bacterium]